MWLPFGDGMLSTRITSLVGSMTFVTGSTKRETRLRGVVLPLHELASTRCV